MGVRGEMASRTSDKFDEEVLIGIDQLIMIRLAQQLGEAPDKVRNKVEGGGSVSNQRPIAELAAHHFSEDIRRFVRSYAEVIPRQSFVVMLESCMAVGLTTILNSVIELLLKWSETGKICKKGDQRPPPLFVDASNGTNPRLRGIAEQSFDDFLRCVERFPIILMGARLIDWETRYNPRIRQQRIVTRPYATEWLNLLGDVLSDRHEESQAILYNLNLKTAILAERLKEEAPETGALLEDAQGNPNPVWRMAEALTLLQGRGNAQVRLLGCLDSCLLTGRPNGLAAKRRVRQTGSITGNKTREIRSLVFTDTTLDYLVHLHLLHSGNRDGVRPLSYKEFLRLLRERYGFCVDEAPPGMTISNDLLQVNRAILERRLRDLGLLMGVNDAEAMKRLNPRFTPREEETDAAD